jgi:hypothetical protein
MGNKQIMISYQELTRLEIYCSNCGLSITLDVMKQHALPTLCPGCMKEFSEEANAALAAYQRFQREATTGKLHVEFRVRCEN